MTYRLHDTYDYKAPDPQEGDPILFLTLPVDDQYWRRTEYDFDEMNKKWTDDRKIAFVEEETRRFIEGVHFMNKGQITYLTGSNYRFLQYWRIPTKDGMAYPQHRKYQREFFYFLDFTSKDEYCEGGAISKPRRVGVTACVNCDVWNLASIKMDKKFSIQNKQRTDAIEVNYDPIKYNIEHYPSLKLSNGKEIFRPQIEKFLVYKTVMGQEVKEQGKNDGLNNHIYVVATVENADDGKGTYRLIRDEFSKYPSKIDISNVLKILRPTAKVGTTQVGKSYYFGTSAEKDTENFQRWKTIYWNSDYNIRERRKTETGLYKYFISGKYSIEGEVLDENENRVALFDKYGECNELLAMRWIEEQKRAYRLKGDWEGLQAVTREYPIEETDPFDSVGGQSCYDTARLAIQLHAIDDRKKKVASGEKDPFLTVGSLQWIEDDRSVEFNPDPYGHWTIYNLPDARWKNKNYFDRSKFLAPDDSSPYLWTADPFSYREAIKGGSDGAIIVGSIVDSSLDQMGGTIHATYLYRPEPEVFLEEVRKAAIFYAAKGLPENNKEWLARDLIFGKDGYTNGRLNYGKFLLTYENGKFRQWRVGEKIAGISNQQKSIEAYVRDTANFIKDPKKGEFDYLKNLWDEMVIKQWMQFDPDNTEKFDAAVAASLWCMVIKNYKHIVVRTQGTYSDTAVVRAFFGIRERVADDW